MVKLIHQASPAKRKTRTPVFPMAGTMKPYGLYPIFAHPVLPGETLQSCVIKNRTISMPLNYPLGGAWLETWLVYVKLTDIDKDLGEMFISDSVATTGRTLASASERTFGASGQIDWISAAIDKLHRSYFRHENEATATKTIDGVPMVKLNNKSWYENMMFQDADVAVPTTDASDLYQHLQEYSILQQMGMVEMTYQKYLEQYGAVLPKEAEGDPEILRFAKSWTLPTSIVEPTTGAPTSAWVWNDEIKADKPKRFNEPGFILGVQCVRPKLYQKHIPYSMVGEMWGFSDWFPIYNLDDPTAGIKEITSASDMFHADARTDAGDVTMIYDHRDLLMNGEQFINNWSTHPYTLPVSTGLTHEDAATPEDIRGEYPTSTDIDAVFKNAASDEKCVYYDGIALMTLSGHVSQSTPL